MTPTDVLQVFRQNMQDRSARIQRACAASSVTVSIENGAVVIEVSWGRSSYKKVYDVATILGDGYNQPQTAWEIRTPYCRVARELMTEVLNARGVLCP